MFVILLFVLFYVVPALTVGYFVFSICRYLYAKSANKRIPGTFSDAVMKERKISLIISSVLAVPFIVAAVCAIVLSFRPIAFM